MIIPREVLLVSFCWLVVMSWRKATLCCVSESSHQFPQCLVLRGMSAPQKPSEQQSLSQTEALYSFRHRVASLHTHCSDPCAVKLLLCLQAAVQRPQRDSGCLLLKVSATCACLPRDLVTRTFVCSMQVAAGTGCPIVLLGAKSVWRVQDCLGHGLSGSGGRCRVNLHFSQAPCGFVVYW